MRYIKTFWKIIGIILFILLIAFSIRTISLSKQYPTPKIVRIDKGQILNYVQCDLDIIDTYIGTMDDFGLEAYSINNYSVSDNAPLDDERCILVKMHVKNIGETPADFIPTNFYIQSGAIQNGLDLLAFYEINKENMPPVTFEPGYEQDVYLPYTLIDFQLTNDHWRNIENLSFDLVIVTYPTKYVMTLTPFSPKENYNEK